MKYLRLRNGDRVPMLGLGTWKSAPGEVYEAVQQALRLGYRHIDCAAIYGNEEEIGRALWAAMEAGEVRREELFITSKLWNNAHLRQDVRPALEKSLEDLQLDYLDLYLIHWPVVFKPGIVLPENDEGYLSLSDVPIAETWSAMEDCVDEGLVRHIGVSNFSARKLGELLEQSRIKPEMNQVEMHPLLRQQGLKDFCDAQGVAITAYSPLGSRDRPAAFKEDLEPDLMLADVIRSIAGKLDIAPAQVLLAWAINRGTCAIPKSVNPQRLKQNLAAADIVLEPGDLRQIDSLDRHFRFISGGRWGGPNTLENLWDE